MELKAEKRFLWHSENAPLSVSEQKHIDRAFLMCVRYGVKADVFKRLNGRANILSLDERGDNVMQVLCLGAKLPKDIWMAPDFQPERSFNKERLAIYEFICPRYKEALDLKQQEENRLFLDAYWKAKGRIFLPEVQMPHVGILTVDDLANVFIKEPVKGLVAPLRLPRQIVKVRRIWRKVTGERRQKIR